MEGLGAGPRTACRLLEGGQPTAHEARFGIRQRDKLKLPPTLLLTEISPTARGHL